MLLSAPGRAASGGASLSVGGASPGGTAGPGASLRTGDATVSASAGGITLTTRASALLRNRLLLAGQAPRQTAGKTVEIERRGRQTGWEWAPTAGAKVNPDGTFVVSWRTNHIGLFSLRAVLAPVGSQAAAASSSATPMLSVTVYRPSLATQYGPGFYGQRTACGKKLARTTIGVANRRLKCGTPVAIYYRGRTMVVPVIDRGPFANGADWDLTEATGKALGIDGTAMIGAVSEPRP